MDTRVYLAPRPSLDGEGRCIGCVIGKNPGSAVPEQHRRGPVAMDLQGDRFLPNVRAIVSKAYARVGLDADPGDYVQVLNLFYLCDRNLTQALGKLRDAGPFPRCTTEDGAFPWAWYVWGGNDKRLNSLKNRFHGLNAKQRFFFDGATRRIVDRVPEPGEMARHTQGLPHEPAVAYLSTLIARSRKAR